MIQFSRVSSSVKSSFFGSDLPVDNHIEMCVYRGKLERSLGRDWYSPKSYNPLIQLKLTPFQFSELITSLNFNSGIPCTLLRVEEEIIAQEESDRVENRKEITHRKFEERMEEFVQKIKDNQERVEKLVKKKTLSKEDQQELLIANSQISDEALKNIPFFLKAFQEAMDGVVLEAKMEIEGAIQHKIATLGMEQLQKSLIEEPK